MTIDDRLALTQQRFNELQAERNELITQANDKLTEMTKIEGEFRLLQELKTEAEQVKPNKKATVIEAVPEEK